MNEGRYDRLLRRRQLCGRRESSSKEGGDGVAVRRVNISGRPQQLAQPPTADEWYIGDAAATDPGQLRPDEAQGAADQQVGMHRFELGADGIDLLEPRMLLSE